MANSKFLHPLPALTLTVGSITATGKDLYGIVDGAGLQNVYRTYNVTLSSIASQTTGDDNIGNYNGLYVRPGDYIALNNGRKTWKIVSISSKSATEVKAIVEDINMGIARSFSDNNNNPNNTNVFIFRTNNNNYPLISTSYAANLTVNNAIDNIKSYLQIHETTQLFTFTPETTGSLKLGDLVSITGSGTGYNLITSSINNIIVGTVFDVYGGHVIVRPYNKIIVDFESPEKLQDGVVGSIFYNIEGGQVSTSSINDSSKQFLYLTPPVATIITGSSDNPVLDPTTDSMYINEVEIYGIDAGGSDQTIYNITGSINASSSLHHTEAGIQVVGGTISVSTGDSAGTGGENGSLRYPSNYGIIAILSDSTGGPGIYPSSEGTFSLTSSDGGVINEILIRPTTASDTVSGYPVATEVDITRAINEAAASASAPITASFSDDSITIEETGGGNLIINKGVAQNGPISNFHIVGNNSSTGIPTGQHDAPPTQYFLTLTREDGGKILFSGSFFTSPSASGLVDTIGTPPFLMFLGDSSAGSGGSGDDDDWYIGNTYLTASKDVLITGSLLINRQNNTSDFFLIKSGSYSALKVDSEGITRFFAYEDADNPHASADYGGIYFMSSSLWAALD